MNTTTLPATPALDWSSLRADFPILDQKVHGQPLVYFDNAATTQKPRAVIDALRHYYEHDNANVHRGIHELSHRATVAFEAARARAASIHQCPQRRRNHFHARHHRRHQSGRPILGRQESRAPATPSCSPKWSITATSSPGNCWPQRTGAKLAYLPVTGDDGLLDLGRLDDIAHPRGQTLRLHPHLQYPRRHQSRRRIVRPRPQARRHHPGRCRPERRPSAGRCAGDRLRFPGLFRPQNVRPHRHRRALRPPRIAGDPCRPSRAAAT